MDLEILKKYITFTSDKVIIDNTFYENVFAPSMDNAIKFKQQLISWLEDKIKECNKSIGTDLLKTNATHSNKIVEVSAYQEVLDFVNKGGKDD